MTTKKGPGHGRVPRFDRPSSPAVDKTVRVTKPAMSPATKPASFLWRHKGKFAASTGGAAIAGGGAAYLYHRNQPKEEEMAKVLKVPMLSQNRMMVAHRATENAKMRTSLLIKPKKSLLRRNTVAKYFNPFDGDVYEFGKADERPIFSKAVAEGGPAIDIKMVKTPAGITGGHNGSPTSQHVRISPRLPRHTISLKFMGGDRSGAGAAVGDGQPGVRVRSPHFRGKHSGAVSA